MNELISRCGLKCSECGVFIATKADDDKKRQEVAEQWSRRYKADIRPEDINCEGCLSEGKKVFNYCNVCEIRKCGIDKDVENCAYCDEYVCSKLESFLEKVPANREFLDEIRENIK